MRTYDANGAQVVCTSTREERMALENAPAVHFVGSESYLWVDE